MKKFTLCFRTLALFGLFAMANPSNAQTPCNSSFVYTVASVGGQVTFSSTATNVTGATNYSWTIYYLPNMGWWTPLPNGTLNGLNPSYSFSVNGTYSVILQMVNNSPACTAYSSQSLVVTGTNVPCSLVADFATTPAGAGAANLNNMSTGTVVGTTYAWNFGDNTAGSSLPSPVHTYSADGIYNATLTANNNFSYSCSQTIVKQVHVCGLQPMSSSFIYTSLPNGLITFTSTSTGTNLNTFYSWYSSNLYNNSFASGVNLSQTSITYSSNGSYGITLWIKNPVTTCSVASIQTIVATTTVTPCNLFANFSINQGTNGFVNFLNASSGTTGNTSYSWNFGDNTTGTSINPIHTYSADGSYQVTLFVNNNAVNTCTAMYSNSIKICSYAQLTSAFTYSTSGNTVSLTSTSTGTNSGTIYNWNCAGLGTFGSGTQASTTFSGSGNYYVTLQTINPVSFCMSTSSQIITIASGTCIANANFSLSPTGTPQYWNAIPTSPGNVSSAVWSWGDGSTSNTLYTSHTYSAAGTYSICLSVTLACGATNTYCMPYYIFRSSGTHEDGDVINVSVIDPATVGIKNNRTNAEEFTISPNPNNGSFNLKMNGLNGHEVELNVFDITGKIIYHEDVQTINDNFTREIQLDQMPDGIYFLKANSDNQIFTKKIVVNQ